MFYFFLPSFFPSTKYIGMTLDEFKGLKENYFAGFT